MAYDIVGVQEAMTSQRLYLSEKIGANYQYYGRPRDKHQGEECGIFVNKDNYEVISDEYSWIS